jgi:hypothetical protein
MSRTAMLVIVAASVGAILASRFMWWATNRSPLWAMAGGALLALVALLGALGIAWLFAYAAYGR